jgi:hypothetical protein
MAIGPYGTVAMGTAPAEVCNELTNRPPTKQASVLLGSRFGMSTMSCLKSDVADMKNIGGREAGAITAGKFLRKVHQLSVDTPRYCRSGLFEQTIGLQRLRWHRRRGANALQLPEPINE